MMYLTRPENFKEWASKTYEKINNTIESCSSETQLNSVKAMTDYFIMVTAMEDFITTEELETISLYFWTRINLKLIHL
jgi:hypothetical protein